MKWTVSGQRSSQAVHSLAERGGFECPIPSYSLGFVNRALRKVARKRLIPGTGKKYVVSKWPENLPQVMPSDSASRWIAYRMTLVASRPSFFDSLASNFSCCALSRMALIFFAVIVPKG